MILAAALAGGLALQLAPPGLAAGEPVPGAEVATPTQLPAVEPAPEPVSTEPGTAPLPSSTATPTATATATPEPQPTGTVSIPATEPAIPEAVVPTGSTNGPDQTLAADPEPLAVQGYVENGFVGKPFDEPLVVSGGTAPYSVTVTDLPPGLAFNEAGLKVTGTPSQAGYYQMTVAVTDSSEPAQTVSRQVSASISEYHPPKIELHTYTGQYPDAVIGLPYEQSIDVFTAGVIPFTTSIVEGQLPPGMSWSNKSASGTPTTVGTYAFTVRATDQFGSSEASFRITVRASAPYAVGYVVPPAVLGEPYSAKIASVTGGVGPYSMWWGTPQHMAGSLHWHDPGPDGLVIDGNGFLNGTPTRAGSFRIYVKFRDAGLVEREIFWTTVTVLETRPPAVEPPPAAQPPAAGEVPPTTVLPAGAVEPASSAELAATGLQSGTLNAMLWAAGGLLTFGTLIAVAAHQSRRRGGAG
ncbi:putative Ig domain-containing protein [Paenarthrobacter sp. NPDC089714]|uniref:putative Ig domain-containing protein n=1 Tax=Paenarthrobacter sp. NPDC089714 TaxID=3364377 RepID=UPI0037FFC045